MTARIWLATTARILQQLRHDPRTIAMMLVIPVVLIALLRYMFDADPRQSSSIILMMLGIFPFIIMFLVTSIAMLRERTTGTLERLMTTPLGRLDLLAAYGTSFGVAAAVQGAVAAGCAYWFFGLTTPGPAGIVVLIAILNGVLGVGFGLLCSAFARTEFQAVQMLPIVVIPQILLCGLFVARGDMVAPLRILSDVMPLSYAVQALQEVGAHPDPTGLLWRDAGIVLGCVALTLTLGAATLRRRSA
jgi:ABC-2 type transport system permease protein